MFKALPILGAARVCVCVCVLCLSTCVCGVEIINRWYQGPASLRGPGLQGCWSLGCNGLCSLVAKTACPGLILYRAQKPSSRQLGDSPQTEEQE